MDHLNFVRDFSALHLPSESPRILFLHSICGVGTNIWPMKREQLPKLESLLDPGEFKHVTVLFFTKTANILPVANCSRRMIVHPTHCSTRIVLSPQTAGRTIRKTTPGLPKRSATSQGDEPGRGVVLAGGGPPPSRGEPGISEDRIQHCRHHVYAAARRRARPHGFRGALRSPEFPSDSFARFPAGQWVEYGMERPLPPRVRGAIRREGSSGWF